MIIDKSKLENKIPDTGGLFKKTDYNTKITEIEDKITNVSNLVTKTTLTTVENKIPSVSNLLKKTDYNTKLQKLKINWIIIIMINIHYSRVNTLATDAFDVFWCF